ncbi:MAG: hypothetical protein ACI31S_06230 [Bacilli bacterium]
MNKKRIITIVLIVVIAFGILGLYKTFAYDTSLSNNATDTYTLTIKSPQSTVTVPASSSKTVIYKVQNTNDGTLKYAVGYFGDNIDVKIYSDSKDPKDGFISNREYKYIKLYITNTGTVDSDATISLVLGYENGGNLIVPSGVTLVTETYSKIVTATNYITNLYTNAEKTTVTNNDVEYNYATSENLMNDRLGGTTTSLDGGNIRYYGADPSNYIYFNCSDYSNQTSDTCELWRIIGVFDGKIKIIRNEVIGTYSWDYDYNDDLSSTTYDNDWSTATLQSLLNNQYYNNIDTTYYSNSSVGEAVNFNSDGIGIKNSATRNMVEEVTWNLGGFPSSLEVYSNETYGYERGETVYEGNPTTWTGKIALAYPSDYGYAADLGSCTQTLNSYNNCTSVNWMLNILTNNGSLTGWLLNPTSLDSDAALFVTGLEYVDLGYVDYNLVFPAFEVAPVLYLDSETGIESGTGTSTDPYRLST